MSAAHNLGFTLFSLLLLSCVQLSRVGMETRPMGVLLKKHGIEAKSTRRDGLAGRYFTFDLKEKIDMLLG